MTEQLISFETAKLAKEKKFDVLTERYYDFIGDMCSNRGVVNWNSSNESLYSAPTQSLLQKWLREEHGLYVLPYFKIGAFHISIRNVDGILYDPSSNDIHKFIPSSVGWDSYEEVLEIGLYEALKLI